MSLVATPDASYRFVNWSGDVGTITHVDDESTTITMAGDYSITANFVQTYNLTVASTLGGSVTMPGEGTFTYDAGEVVSLIASPGVSYWFVNWSGDVGTIADVNTASTTIIMNGDYSITANFVEGVLGDANGDDTVDSLDFVVIGAAFNSVLGSPNWNPNADLNRDGLVDIFDVVWVALNYGKIKGF